MALTFISTRGVTYSIFRRALNPGVSPIAMPTKGVAFAPAVDQITNRTIVFASRSYTVEDYVLNFCTPARHVLMTVQAVLLVVNVIKGRSLDLTKEA